MHGVMRTANIMLLLLVKFNSSKNVVIILSNNVPLQMVGYVYSTDQRLPSQPSTCLLNP